MRDAGELVAESDQQNTQLFELLDDPGGSEVDFSVERQRRPKVTADQLVDRAKDTDVPDQLKSAHGEPGSRRSSCGGMAWAESPTPWRHSGAPEGGPAAPPDARLAAQMQFFLASDVIYSQRFLPRLLGTHRGGGPLPGRPRSGHAHEAEGSIRFLPTISWLNPEFVASKLGGIAGGGSDEPGRARAAREPDSAA